MPFVRPRRSAAVFAAGLGVALVAGLGVQPAQAAGSTTHARPLSATETPVVSGSYKLGPTNLYLGVYHNLDTTNLVVTDFPSNVSTIRLDWGDFGTSVDLTGRRPAASHKYTFTGNFDVKVTEVTADGESEPATVGTVRVKFDFDAPAVKLSKPRKPNRVSHWSRINGTARDKGAGMLCVMAAIFEKRGSKWYYFTGKTWKKGDPFAQSRVDRAYREIPVRKGAWSYRLTGLKKGKLVVLYYGIDKLGNHPTLATVVKATLTK